MSNSNEDLPDPDRLRRAALIHYEWGEQKFDIVCTACSLRSLRWPKTGELIVWLHCSALPTGEVDWEGTTRMMNVLIPANYVTSIKPGPTFRLGPRRAAEAAEKKDLGVFPPIHPAPEGSLPLEDLEQAIVALLDPTMN